MRFEQAHIILGNGHARLSPALVRGGENDEARLEADYALDSQTLDLAISTDTMKVQCCAQVALAAVLVGDRGRPVERRLTLPPRRRRSRSRGSGRLATDAIAIPGLADPVG